MVAWGRSRNVRGRRGSWVLCLGALLCTGQAEADDEIFRDVAVSPDGRHVYAARDEGLPTLVVYDRAPDGTLSVRQTLPPSACDPTMAGPYPLSSVTVSPDGSQVYATSNAVRPNNAPPFPPTPDSAVFVFGRVTDAADPAFGKLTLQQVIEHGSVAPTPVDGIKYAQNIVLSPDGKFAYVVAGVGLHRLPIAVGPVDRGALVSFRRDAGGNLSFLGELHGDFDGDGVSDLSGTNHLVVSPDGLSLYVVGTNADTLVHFRRDPVSGLPSFAEVIPSSATQGSLGTPYEVVVSNDGRFVYVAASNGYVSWYGRRLKDAAGAGLAPDHADFGKLTYLGRRKPVFNGTSPLGVNSTALSLDPAQSYLYVASATGGATGAIHVYERDAVSGELALQPAQQLADGHTTGALVMAPALPGGGDQLLGVALRLFRLNVYGTHPASGELTWIPPAYGEPTPVPYCTPTAKPSPTDTPTRTPKPTLTPTRTPAPSAHDSAALPHVPLSYAFSGAALREAHAFLSVRNMDTWESPGHMVRMIVTDGMCPSGTVIGKPVFPATDDDTIAMKGGVKRFARVDFRFEREDFAELPATCAVTLRVETIGPSGAFDPDGTNDQVEVPIELDP